MPSQTIKPSLFALVLLCLCTFNSNTASAAASPDHWVGTWAAAPVAVHNDPTQFGAIDSTIREIVHVSIGGPTVRIILSNEFGTDPLTIGAASIALSGPSATSEINPASAIALTFGGRTSVTIPSGALIVSDPADLKLPALSDLTVSLFLPAQAIHQVSAHTFANQINYTVHGNFISMKSLDSPKEIASWPFLKGVDVKTSDNTASIVAFGDSITDGSASTRNTNNRWPDLLAQRLQANQKTSTIGVLNLGIGGNRILHDATGPNALSRFDRDVIAQAGVKYLIILEGINDIGVGTVTSPTLEPVTAADIIVGIGQMAIRAHTHGIKVFGATLTPYVGATYQTPAGEAIRQAVNQWIRSTNQLDGVIDFDKATQDPANPTVFSPAADSGDHLHPKDAGYKAMGDAIDLKLFTR